MPKPDERASKPLESFHLVGIRGDVPTVPDGFILGLIKKALKTSQMTTTPKGKLTPESKHEEAT